MKLSEFRKYLKWENEAYLFLDTFSSYDKMGVAKRCKQHFPDIIGPKLQNLNEIGSLEFEKYLWHTMVEAEFHVVNMVVVEEPMSQRKAKDRYLLTLESWQVPTRNCKTRWCSVRCGTAHSCGVPSIFIVSRLDTIRSATYSKFAGPCFILTGTQHSFLLVSKVIPVHRRFAVSQNVVTCFQQWVMNILRN